MSVAVFFFFMTGSGRDCGRGRGSAGVAYFSLLTECSERMDSAFLALI